MSCAWLACWADVTVPLSTTLSLSASALTLAPCSWRASWSFRSATSEPTKISSVAICLPCAVEEDGVGLADLERHDEDAARRANDGIDDLRIGDDDVARVDIELDDRGLVERERHALRRARWVGDKLDDARCRSPAARHCSGPPTEPLTVDDRDGQQAAVPRCASAQRQIIVTATHCGLPSDPLWSSRSTPARKTLMPLSSTP